MLNIIGFIHTVRLNSVNNNADKIMRTSSVRYIINIKLRGSFFNPEDVSGLVSNVDTDF